MLKADFDVETPICMYCSTILLPSGHGTRNLCKLILSVIHAEDLTQTNLLRRMFGYEEMLPSMLFTRYGFRCALGMAFYVDITLDYVIYILSLFRTLFHCQKDAAESTSLPMTCILNHLRSFQLRAPGLLEMPRSRILRG